MMDLAWLTASFSRFHLVPTLRRGNAVRTLQRPEYEMRRWSVGQCSHAGAWEPGL